jgi:STAM-binding protein
VQQNTLRGLEFAGVLAGVLSEGGAAFAITSLIIPKQKGEANNVEMLNEEELFEYQEPRGLLQLGWIHTHPTQSCFLSSIDVHTQYGYQVRRRCFGRQLGRFVPSRPP